MSVVSKPNKTFKEPRWCRYCTIKETSFMGTLNSRIYPVNTLLMCDDCGRLWVVRIDLGNSFYFWRRTHNARKLRWYHYANRHKPKEVDA